MSTASLFRISHRVATDGRWEVDSESYLGQLLSWGQLLAEPVVETPDVLRTYALAPRCGRCVLVAEQ